MCKRLTTFVLLTISLLVQSLVLSSVFAAPSPDFDEDGVVGVPDFLLFISVYGSSRGDETYQVRYDLDGDGVIGIPDFLIFVDNFGKEVSSGGMAVSIPDANLRAVIAESLGKEKGALITTAEMATLNDLIAVQKNISDLTGLECATQLRRLNLAINSISNITPLSGLTNLTRLELSYNSITDVSSLSGLTNLTDLYLSINSISDVSPLSGLINLDGLYLSSNNISDIAPLVANMGLSSGDRVDVRDNPLSASSFNMHIPALQSRGVEVSYSTPVSIPDANLRAVIADSLSKAKGVTITRADMSTLTRLDALNANITDLTGLEFATRLRRLNLGIELDLGIIVYVPGEGIVMSGEDIVNSNHISDLSPLSGLTNLTHLDLTGNSVSDLSPLSSLTSLEALYLSSNSISDVSPLSGLTNLIWLELSDNSITDFSPLSGLTSLIVLALSSNSIADVSLLSGLINLDGLYLSSNNISDITPLVANMGLSSGDEVDVTNNPLSATSINMHIPALRDRGVTVWFGASKPGVEEIEWGMILENGKARTPPSPTGGK